MKVLATICLLLVPQAAPAAPDTVSRTGEQAVLSAYRRMEEADRKATGNCGLPCAIAKRRTP